MTSQGGDPVSAMLSAFVAAHPHARVIDVGGGSGVHAVPLARAGCRVLVVDASTDALASLGRRAAEAGVGERIESLQADADDLAAILPAASADLVLCHHVVQEVENPERSVRAAAAVLRPGGTLSIVVPGRLSAVLVEALAGHYDAAARILHGDPADDRRYDVPALRSLIEQAGLRIDSMTGVGVLAALAGDRALAARDGAADLERAVSEHAVLGQIAGDLHAVARRPA